MICQCPKCESKTQLDLTDIPEEGVSAKCPECKTRFWVTRESFAQRAVKKEGKRFCYCCNSELNNYIDCPACGMMYPEYSVVQLSKPVKKAKRKTSSSLSFSIIPQRRARSQSSAHAPERSPKKTLMMVALLAVVVVVGIGLGMFYFHKKAESKYAAGYINALYVMKLGTDTSVNECATIAAAAKVRAAAGQSADLRISDESKARLNAAKTDVDATMKKVPPPPKKFLKANENLLNLYTIFTKSSALASAPSGTPQSFTDAASKVENEFKQTASQLKSNLPPELAQKLQNSYAKFRELRDL